MNLLQSYAVYGGLLDGMSKMAGVSAAEVKKGISALLDSHVGEALDHIGSHWKNVAGWGGHVPMGDAEALAHPELWRGHLDSFFAKMQEQGLPPEYGPQAYRWLENEFKARIHPNVRAHVEDVVEVPRGIVRYNPGGPVRPTGVSPAGGEGSGALAFPESAPVSPHVSPRTTHAKLPPKTVEGETLGAPGSDLERELSSSHTPPPTPPPASLEGATTRSGGNWWSDLPTWAKWTLGGTGAAVPIAGVSTALGVQGSKNRDYERAIHKMRDNQSDLKQQLYALRTAAR